jgi:protein phosphatase
MTPTYDISHRATMGARRYQEDACAFAVVGPRERTGAPQREPALAGAGASDEGSAAPAPSAVASHKPLLAVLADGMGGHVGGARASKTACRAFIDTYLAAARNSDSEPGGRLEAALAAANAALAEAVAGDRALNGMGCTLIGALLDGALLRWISVGDSHLFLLRKGELFLLNENHSLAPVLDELAAQGQITPDEAASHPRRHYLRSALTGEEIELVDFVPEGLALEPGDWVVLASDGIDTLEPDEIADLIERGAARGGADGVAEGLIAAIDGLAAPGQDNTTVMAVGVG